MKALALVLVTSSAFAGVPKGYAVVPKSRSPDGKLEVIAPTDDETKPDQLVDVATGTPIASLVSRPALVRQNHLDAYPTWSKDGALLEWYVDGKWGSWALVLVRIDHGNVTQIDARALAVREVLAEVQRAHPKAAVAAKRQGESSGSWFSDGLAIDIKPSGTKLTDDGLIVPPPALPLALDVTYTSNPKQLDDYPRDAVLDGALSLAIDGEGKLARR